MKWEVSMIEILFFFWKWQQKSLIVHRHNLKPYPLKSENWPIEDDRKNVGGIQKIIEIKVHYWDKMNDKCGRV